MNPTMTINEVLDAKRARGIPCSPVRERTFLLAGRYPYGIAVENPGKQLVAEIYRKKFNQWLDEVAPEEGDESR